MYGNNSSFTSHLTNFNKDPHRDPSNPKRVNVEDIDNITLEDYGWTADAIKNYFMFGIDIKDENGNILDEHFYSYLFESAIAEAEQELDIVILPRLETEIHDYNEQEFQSFMFTHVRKKPIIQVEHLGLQFNGKPIYDYPSDWWKVYSLPGHIEIFPTTLMQTGGDGYNTNAFLGYPNLNGATATGYNRTFAPQMIKVEYVAGLLPRKREGITREYEIPANLHKLVVQYAMKELFKVGGRLIIGAGIASRSLSMDDVTESVVTTQSAMYGGYSADILQIDADIKDLVNKLRSYFGTNMTAL